MKKTGIVYVISMMILMFLYVQPAWAHKDRVVAVVNGDVITLSELDKTFAPILERIEADPRARGDVRVRDEAKRFVIDRMIKEMLMKQEAQRLNIQVRETDIDAYIDDMLRTQNMTRRDLLEGLADENTSYEEYRETIRREIMKSRLLSREIRARVNVSDEDIGDYYKKKREIYEGKEAVRIQQILTIVPRGSDVAATRELRKRAERVHERLMAGESFDAMVQQYSQGPEIRTGGDLGFIEKGMIHPQVEAVAFDLEKGGMSGVIESPVGFHIIKVIDKRGAGLKPLEEVRQEIIEKIADERMEERFQKWLEDLKGKAYIELRL